MDSTLPRRWRSISLNKTYWFFLMGKLDYYPTADIAKLSHATKANDLSLRGEYDEAIICYDKALEIDPNYATAWCFKGNALRTLKKYDEAIICYDKALEIDPNYATAWNHKGMWLDTFQRYDEAIKCYDKAIMINPNETAAWNNKGIAFINLKKYDEAIKCYDKVLEIDPSDSNARKNISYVQLQQNRESTIFESISTTSARRQQGYYRNADVWAKIFRSSQEDINSTTSDGPKDTEDKRKSKTKKSKSRDSN
jgi:tetratricopeptide (TPR) repeat protein